MLTYLGHRPAVLTRQTRNDMVTLIGVSKNIHPARNHAMTKQVDKNQGMDLEKYREKTKGYQGGYKKFTNEAS